MERYYRTYLNALRKKNGGRMPRFGLSADTSEGQSPQQHYLMAKRDRDHVYLYALADKHIDDPALKVGDATSCSFAILIFL